MVNEGKSIFEFGQFQLDVSEHLLLHNESTVPLTPKAFELLLMLVQNSGHILEKDKIIREIWVDTFVGEATLAQNIFTLRKALADNQDEHQYIETIPKRGYRFIAIVKEVWPKSTGKGRRARLPAGKQEGGIKPDDSAIASLAILPLINATEDPRAEYLSDGITESIINNLSQISQLRVMARSTSCRYKTREVDAREVGQELGVRAVLVGRVLQIAGKLIIRTELVDVANGWQIWGEQYKCDPGDLFGVEQEIADQISQKLKMKLTADQQKRLGFHHTDSLEAYQLYLRGRSHWNERRLQGYKTARKYFEQAIALDPNFALAYSGLADTYSLQDVGFHGFVRPKDALSKAQAAAIKALQLDSALAEAHHSLAYVKLVYEWDWVGTESEFVAALKLNPRYGHALHWYSHFLMAMGRTQESVAAGKRAIENEPFDLGMSQHLGWHCLNTRKYDQAIEYLQETLKLDPNFYPPNLMIAMAYAQQHEFSQAIAHIQKARQLENIPPVLSSLGYIYALSGQTKKALMLLKELTESAKLVYIAPYDIALIHIGLGDKERAFEFLGRAYHDRNEQMCWLKVSPELESLRSDQRFADLVKRMDLPPSS